MKRGFEVEKGVVEGYYRKLRPAGARVVRRRLGVVDYLGVKEGVGGRVWVCVGERMDDLGRVWRMKVDAITAGSPSGLDCDGYHDIRRSLRKD